MELSLDSVDQVPKDTFVSIRVGDYQKQSRFGSAKTYRFPQADDKHRFVPGMEGGQLELRKRGIACRNRRFHPFAGSKSPAGCSSRSYSRRCSAV